MLGSKLHRVCRLNLLTSSRKIGSCCAKGYFAETEHGDKAFSIRTVHLKYGKVLEEVGDSAHELLDGKNKSRIGLFTDKNIEKTEHFDIVKRSLANIFDEVHVYNDVSIEPTDVSFMEAGDWVKETKPDLCVSLGGGSVMDTTKAALLYGFHPPPDNNFFYYVNKPVGEGGRVPRLGMPPHIAIPTTSGTGSECTGFAICKITKSTGGKGGEYSKTGIASERLCPTLAMVDPRVTLTMPSTVVASSGFDVLCHAIESFTARPFSRRPVVQPAHLRPLNQGANPYSDFACMETFRLCGEFFERAIADKDDHEARERMLWASTLVGTAMGNCGVAIPHGLSYPVCGHNKSFTPANGYPKDKPLVPHGMGVAICAPAAIRAASKGCPERHLISAQLLKAENAKDASLEDSGEVLAQEVIRLMKIAKFPSGIIELGFTSKDIPTLSSACFQQKRVIDNAPVVLTESDIHDLYHDCGKYW